MFPTLFHLPYLSVDLVYSEFFRMKRPCTDLTKAPYFQSLGIVGNLNSVGVRCFGPTAEAAQLESSKRFAKEFMDRHGISTARWKAFTKPEKACDFIMR